jgi:hypothetical protein
MDLPACNGRIMAADWHPLRCTAAPHTQARQLQPELALTCGRGAGSSFLAAARLFPRRGRRAARVLRSSCCPDGLLEQVCGGRVSAAGRPRLLLLRLLLLLLQRLVHLRLLLVLW